MTYAEKLLQWRGEMGQMASELLDSDDPDQALMLVEAIAMVKRVHCELGKLGLDSCDWAPPETPQ